MNCSLPQEYPSYTTKIMIYRNCLIQSTIYFCSLSEAIKWIWK